MTRLFSSMLSLAFACGLVGALGGGAVSAKACHDAKGRFTKCPSTVGMPTMKKRCRDTKGKFMKCQDPIAMPPKKM